MGRPVKHYRQPLAAVLLLLTAVLHMRRCPMYTNPTDFFMMLMKQEPESQKLREAWESAERAALEAPKPSEVGSMQRDRSDHLREANAAHHIDAHSEAHNLACLANCVGGLREC